MTFHGVYFFPLLKDLMALHGIYFLYWKIWWSCMTFIYFLYWKIWWPCMAVISFLCLNFQNVKPCLRDSIVNEKIWLGLWVKLLRVHTRALCYFVCATILSLSPLSFSKYSLWVISKVCVSLLKGLAQRSRRIVSRIRIRCDHGFQKFS